VEPSKLPDSSLPPFPQLNDNCNETRTFLAFNDADIGTVNSINNLVVLPKAYSDAQFESELPESTGLWPVDEACKLRCGL
jgi:hypothetical protein